MEEFALSEKELDEFCYTVFKAMDALGFLPISLKSREATPSRLEKYPRLLLGYLQRYDDSIIAFKEWESKLLRDVPSDDANFRKDKYFGVVSNVEKWLENHKDMFSGRNKKLVIQHLRGSLYARIFAYMYPRRAICFAVSDEMRDRKGSYEEALQQFDNIVAQSRELHDIKGIMDVEEWNMALTDAKQIFADASGFYRKVIEGKMKETKETIEGIEREDDYYDER
jgi:hypothetical protein